MSQTFSTLVVGLSVALGGCDQTFEPLEAHDPLLSMYGVLQVGADTQWIRVMPVRDSAFTQPGPLDVTVTLERVETGRIVQLRDSIVHHSGSDSLVPDVWAHNFWTTEPIVAASSYRVRATASTGAQSTALVKTPPVPARIGVNIAARNVSRVYDYVRVYGVDHVAMVDMLFHIGGGCGTYDGRRYIEHKIDSAASADEGPPVVRLARAARTLFACDRLPVVYWIDLLLPPDQGTALVQWWDLSIVLSGAPWPFPDYFSAGAVAHSGIASNVENGVGFVGGILRTEVPYETCEILNRPTSVTHCELIYDARSAAIEGQVPASAHIAPGSRAFVTLSEVEGNKIRLVRCDNDGFFRFGALEPGKSYRLRVEKDGLPPVEQILIMGVAERRILEPILLKPI